MTKECNVSILGYGMMGLVRAVAYEAVMRYYPDCPVKPVLNEAYCYTDGEAEAAAASGWKANRDLDKTIENQKTDYIDVCLPNKLHCMAVLKALAAGKHVFCEKPLSVTVEEAHQMVEALAKAKAKAQENGGDIIDSVNFIYRRVPANVFVRKLVKEKRFGELLEVHSFYNQSWGGPNTPWSWRFGPEGGTLGDLGSHALDMLYFTTGLRPVDLCAMQTTHIKKRYLPETVGSDLAARYGDKKTNNEGRPMKDVETDDATRVLFTLDGGAIGSLECTRNAWGTENTHGYELYFENGAIRWNYDDLNYVGLYDATTPERGWSRVLCNRGGFAYPSFADGHMFGYRDLTVNACYENMLKIAGAEEVAPVATFEDALNVERTIEAIRKSWNERRWVSLSEIA